MPVFLLEVNPEAAWLLISVVHFVVVRLEVRRLDCVLVNFPAYFVKELPSGVQGINLVIIVARMFISKL